MNIDEFNISEDSVKELLLKYAMKIENIVPSIKKTHSIYIDLAKPLDFCLSKIDDSFKNKLSGYCIYVIKINEKISNKNLKTYKLKKYNSENSIKLPQINDTNIESKYLYVGSSKNIKTRLKQHIGKVPKGTYSLRLKDWFLGEIHIDIYCFHNNQDEVQIIEDLLWEKLKPIFGRQGKK